MHKSLLNWFLTLMIFQFMLFAEGDGDGDGGGLLNLGGEGGGEGDGEGSGGEGDGEGSGGEGDGEGHKESIYGKLDVKWPANMPEDLKNDVSIKPFVDSKTGEVNVGNLMKSYNETKKSFGNKIAIPGEHATKEELDEFFNKTTKYEADLEKYGVERKEDSKIPEDFFKDIKGKLHEARVPAAAAQDVIEYLETQSIAAQEGEVTKQAEKIEAEIKGLETEWGAAFKDNINVVQNFIIDQASDEFKAYANETGLVNDVPFTKFVYAMAQEFNGEASTNDSKTKPSGSLTPAEAQTKINEIMADKKGAYYDPNHPSYQDVQKQMQKLYQMKAGK